MSASGHLHVVKDTTRSPVREELRELLARMRAEEADHEQRTKAARALRSQAHDLVEQIEALDVPVEEAREAYARSPNSDAFAAMQAAAKFADAERNRLNIELQSLRAAQEVLGPTLVAGPDQYGFRKRDRDKLITTIIADEMDLSSIIADVDALGAQLVDKIAVLDFFNSKDGAEHHKDSIDRALSRKNYCGWPKDHPAVAPYIASMEALRIDADAEVKPCRS